MESIMRTTGNIREAPAPRILKRTDLLPVDLPSPRFERARWSTARTESVEHVLETWSDQPDLVRVFEDPKLGRAELVMLRKDRYDQLLKVLRNLACGQAGIRVELEGLAKVQVALRTAVERMQPDPLLESLVGLMGDFMGQIESSIVVLEQAHGERSPADEETLKFLREEDEEEREDEASPREAKSGEG